MEQEGEHRGAAQIKQKEKKTTEKKLKNVSRMEYTRNEETRE